MQYEHSIALAPDILKSCGFDERLLFRVQDWASSLLNCELADHVCLSVHQAFESDAAGMYCRTAKYSIPEEGDLVKLVYRGRSRLVKWCKLPL